MKALASDAPLHLSKPVFEGNGPERPAGHRDVADALPHSEGVGLQEAGSVSDPASNPLAIRDINAVRRALLRPSHILGRVAFLGQAEGLRLDDGYFLPPGSTHSLPAGSRFAVFNQDPDSRRTQARVYLSLQAVHLHGPMAFTPTEGADLAELVLFELGRDDDHPPSSRGDVMATAFFAMAGAIAALHAFSYAFGLTPWILAASLFLALFGAHLVSSGVQGAWRKRGLSAKKRIRDRVCTEVDVCVPKVLEHRR